MTTDIINPVLAAEEISEKARVELEVLNNRIPELREQLANLERERQHLDQARRDDVPVLAHALQQYESAERRSGEALEYARYCNGLAGMKEATRTALEREDQAKEAHRLYETTRNDIESRDQARTARLEEIAIERQMLDDELTAALLRVEMVTRVSTRAVAELGQATYERLSAELENVYVAQEVEAKDALVRAQMNRQRFIDQAVEQLAAWPDLQQQLQPEEVYEDSVTEMLERELDYIAAIKAASNIIGPVVQNLPSMQFFNRNWRELAQISAGQDLYPLGTWNAHDDARAIDARERRVRAVLEEYRAKKKKML